VLRDACVFTWRELWHEVRRLADDGPGRLSPAARCAALLVAVERSRRDGRYERFAALVETPGFRRRLSGLFAGWTAAGHDRRRRAPAGLDPEDWATFRHYRRILGELGDEDDAGFARWASESLDHIDPAARSLPTRLVIVDASLADRSGWRAIRALAERVERMLVTLPWEDRPERREVYADVGPLRAQLLEAGFREEIQAPEPQPPALETIAGGLFRDPPPPASDDCAAITSLGMPEGDGEALGVARTVREALDSGAPIEHVAVVFPQSGELVERVAETLTAWGLPSSGAGPRPLARDPSVALLIAALRIPLDGWETARLAHLLRHGRLDPRWPELGTRDARQGASTALRECRVFRGREAILAALARRAGEPSVTAPDPDSDTRKAARARAALPVVERLVACLGRLEGRAGWEDHCRRVRALIGELGLDRGGDATALESLNEALDDQAGVLLGLGLHEKPWTAEAFAREVQRIARELNVSDAPPMPGTLTLAAIDEAAGASASHVILAGLGEGSLPAREVLEAGMARAVPPVQTDDSESSDPAATALAREMRRLLAVAGMATTRLAFVHPTADEAGQDVPPAGFFDEIRELFTFEAWERASRALRRIDPCLPGSYCAARRDRVVRAVGLACRGELDALAQLAANPGDGSVLRGIAGALRVNHLRLGRRRVGPYDGLLNGRRALGRVGGLFAPERAALSPSQLESFAFCPFQFFQRYVLDVRPIAEPDELGEDRVRRGSLLHRALEEYHGRAVATEREITTEAVREELDAILNALWSEREPPASDVEAGLREIERRRVARLARRYAEQLACYLSAAPRPRRTLVEVAFGKPDARHAALTLSDGPDSVAIRLQGVIDRIDLIETPQGTRFRVIDYKTGPCPSRKDVENGHALQLPLYALAAEQVIFPDQDLRPLDAAYWAIADVGFRKILAMQGEAEGKAGDADTWPQLRDALVRRVLAALRRIRGGHFVVRPRTEDCERSCDYLTTCRIRQVRPIEKVTDEGHAAGERPS
jgi:ATP-dependent helicase/nuclease subunit B